MSCREELPHIREGLQFNRVPGRIAKKHGRLFSWFPLEPRIGLDHELDLPRQSIGQPCPCLHIQHQSKMTNRDLFAIDIRLLSLIAFIWCEMRNNLMSEKVKVDPMVAGTTFQAPKQTTVKVTCGRKIMDWKG